VSSILKALQKLEADSNSLRSWKMNGRTAGKINRRPRGLLFFGTLLSLAILAFAGGVIYFRNPDGTMNNFFSSAFRKYLSQPDQDTMQPIHRKMPEPQKRRVQRATPPPGTRAGAQTGGLSGSQPLAGDAPDNRIADTVPEKPQQSPSMRIDKEKPIQKRSDLHAAQLKTQQVQSPKPPAPAVPETHISKDASIPPIVHDPSISLQAIAWAEDPQERIVVINGQILREGESVEGIVIEGIKEDRVIVRKGIESMTLLFRNK